MIATIMTIAPTGFDGTPVTVEADLKQGLPAMHIVGMGNKAIEEARERVRSAISNSLLDFPSRKLIVSLAPAELPKDGAQYDLPIALSILVVSGQLKQADVTGAVFVGELSLSGDIRPIRGVITVVEAAKRSGAQTVYVPLANHAQAHLVEGVTVIGVNTLQALFLHLKKEVFITTPPPQDHTTASTDAPPTIDDIHGQSQAKRALQIAAAGRHNILFIGPPGAGKTMLAKSLVSLLPPLTKPEQLEVTRLHSLIGDRERIVTTRPFRAPHHSSSAIALIGGGAKPRPGEIILAHHGVLFLDELPEYSRASLEALRQPLEDHIISIARSGFAFTYPAQFMLVATMNPCPCGYYGDMHKQCVCSQTQIAAYQKRLSGPLLDRIDMVIRVNKLKQDELLYSKSLTEKQHSKVFEHILGAQVYQKSEQKSSVKYNAFLSNNEIKKRCTPTPEAQTLLHTAVDKLQLTTRSYFKIIKIAQTIADLEVATNTPHTGRKTPIHPPILPHHIAEALQYRMPQG